MKSTSLLGGKLQGFSRSLLQGHPMLFAVTVLLPCIAGSRFFTAVCAAALEAECDPASQDRKVIFQNERRNKHVTGVEGGRHINLVVLYLTNTWLSSLQLGFQNQQAGGRLIAQPLSSCSENHSSTLPVTPSTH